MFSSTFPKRLFFWEGSGAVGWGIQSHSEGLVQVSAPPPGDSCERGRELQQSALPCSEVGGCGSVELQSTKMYCSKFLKIKVSLLIQLKQIFFFFLTATWLSHRHWNFFFFFFPPFFPPSPPPSFFPPFSPFSFSSPQLFPPVSRFFLFFCFLFFFQTSLVSRCLIWELQWDKLFTKSRRG